MKVLNILICNYNIFMNNYREVVQNLTYSYENQNWYWSIDRKTYEYGEFLWTPFPNVQNFLTTTHFVTVFTFFWVERAKVYLSKFFLEKVLFVMQLIHQKNVMSTRIGTEEMIGKYHTKNMIYGLRLELCAPVCLIQVLLAKSDKSFLVFYKISVIFKYLSYQTFKIHFLHLS